MNLQDLYYNYKIYNFNNIKLDVCYPYPMETKANYEFCFAGYGHEIALKSDMESVLKDNIITEYAYKLEFEGEYIPAESLESYYVTGINIDFDSMTVIIKCTYEYDVNAHY